MKKLLILLALLSCGLTASAQELSATFVQKKTLKAVNKVIPGEGKVTFKAPDYLNMTYDVPEGEYLIIEGMQLKNCVKGKVINIDTSKNPRMRKMRDTLLDCIMGNYEKAAQQGLAEAQNMCGRYYEEGWSAGIRKNNAQAVGYYTLAADQGYAPGLWNLGLCYYEGSGLIKDYSKAFRYFMQAAGKDYKLACNKVGFMYKIGQGVEKNLDEAVRWYTKAASSPHNMARAQLSLGELYASEELSDFEKAVVWYRKAQANSDKDVTVKASRFLGDLLFYGKHVEQNYSEAFKYYSVCADRSDAQIQFNLAEMYYLGLGTGKNAEKAVYWYKKVLDQDAAHVEASRRMGVMYLEGIHVEQNCEKAEELLALAADAGDTDACCRLGVMILEDQCRNHVQQL